MAGVIYGLCALASISCGWLILKSYLKTGYRLLLWSGLCFAGLAINNMLLVIDQLVVPERDLSTLRLGTALVALLLLLYGLIWEEE